MAEAITVVAPICVPCANASGVLIAAVNAAAAIL